MNNEMEEMDLIPLEENGSFVTQEEPKEKEASGNAEKNDLFIPDDGRAWYVVHCYSGYENKVRHSRIKSLMSLYRLKKKLKSKMVNAARSNVAYFQGIF